MPATATESFCERCGTRYTFGTPRAERKGIGASLGALIRGRDELENNAYQPLDPFLGVFRFCLECRQYTCPSCWNDEAGFCASCVPLPDAPPLTDASLESRLPILADVRPEPEAWPTFDLILDPNEDVLAANAPRIVPPAEPPPVAEPAAASPTVVEPATPPKPMPAPAPRVVPMPMPMAMAAPLSMRVDDESDVAELREREAAARIEAERQATEARAAADAAEADRALRAAEVARAVQAAEAERAVLAAESVRAGQYRLRAASEADAAKRLAEADQAARLDEAARVAQEIRVAEEARLAEEARVAEEVRVAEAASLAKPVLEGTDLAFDVAWDQLLTGPQVPIAEASEDSPVDDRVAPIELEEAVQHVEPIQLAEPKAATAKVKRSTAAKADKSTAAPMVAEIGSLVEAPTVVPTRALPIPADSARPPEHEAEQVPAVEPVPAVPPPPTPAPQVSPLPGWSLLAPEPPPADDGRDTTPGPWPPQSPVYQPPATRPFGLDAPTPVPGAPLPYQIPATPPTYQQLQQAASPGMLMRSHRPGTDPARSASGIRPCGTCGLPVSAVARFCRRCGVRQD